MLQRVDVDAAHVAVHADHGRQSGRQVQVGGLVLDAEGKELGYVHESPGKFGLRLRQIMTTIRDNLQSVSTRIDVACAAAGRAPGSVRLLAVSKTFGPDAVREAHAAGQRAFGENYIQEAVEKMAALDGLDAEWHCIGPVQSNKTRLVAEHFDWAHTVDRLKIAQRLSEQRPTDLAPLQVCIQVNIDGGSTKAGVAPDALADLAQAIVGPAPAALRGLMTIPEPGQISNLQRTGRAPAARAVRCLRNAQGLALDTLSMGMSADLEAAIHAGSTMVRVGTAIFGARAPMRP